MAHYTYLLFISLKRNNEKNNGGGEMGRKISLTEFF